MSEKALLVKSATSIDGRYYAIGLSSPHVRIFDTARGALCAHIDLAEKMAGDKRAGLQSAIRDSVATTYHDRTQELAAIRDVTLTAVHIASLGGRPSASLKTSQGTEGEVEEFGHVCVAGFSNGTVIATRLADDAVLYHVAVSDTQQPAIAFASTAEYLFVLCANKQLHVVEVATGARLVLGMPVPANTTALAVYAPTPTATQQQAPGCVDVLLCGTSTLYCSLHVPSHRNYSAMSIKMPSLGGSSTPATHAYIGSTLSNGTGLTNIGITCSASEGVVRVWDLSPNAASGQSAGSRCRRILPCNHRVAGMSVMPERGVVSVVTFAGQVLVWEFLNADGSANAKGQSAIIARAGDAYAQPANISIASTTIPSNSRGRYQKFHQRGVVRGVATSRIISACLVPNPTQQASDAAAGASCSLVVVRGKYSLPKFDGASLGPVFSSNLLAIDHSARGGSNALGSSDPEHHLYLTSPGVTIGGNSVLGPNLSFNPHEGVVATAAATKERGDDEEDEDDEAALAQFELKIGAGWATHSADAHRAMVTATEEYAKPAIFHAASMKQLPTVGSMSTKDADKAMERALGKKEGLTSSTEGQTEEAAEAEAPSAPSAKRGKQQLGALGLAVVPLYQALHANDKSLTMELITLASRSQADIVATIRRLELPYVLQLFHILSERLITLNQMDHPFHTWVAAILQARGVEMISETNNSYLKSQGCSTPKQFVAPLRNNYDSMLEMQDRLAVLYGRLSIFHAVKPRADSIAKNTHATVRKGTIGADPALFPNCFKEVAEKKKRKSDKESAHKTTYTVARVNASALGGSKARSTAQIRDDKRAALKAENKRKAAIDAQDDDNAAGEAQDDVFDEADEDEMMEHLNDMTLDDSDEGDASEDSGSEEDGSVIADDDAADEDAERDSEESSADEADNLLDSEDELGLEEEEDEEDLDAEEDDEDDQDDDDDDDVGGDDDDDDEEQDEDGDDVDDELRHEHDQSHKTEKSVDDKQRNRRMRTD